jgi:hypothetical protein
MIVAAGRTRFCLGLLRSLGGNSFVTGKTDLPRNWSKLVAKYRNVVSDYAGYEARIGT